MGITRAGRDRGSEELVYFLPRKVKETWPGARKRAEEVGWARLGWHRVQRQEGS